MYNFGTGFLTLIPSGATPSPVKVGVLQEVSIEISTSMKELRGGLQYAVDIARGAGKISGKAKYAQINGGILNAVLTGATQTSNSTVIGVEESGTIPATPYAITVANSATWSEDLGVLDLTSGIAMTRVASGSTPTTGQYKVTAGVYTFAAADTTHSVLISYSYTATTAGSQKIVYTNQPMGSGTVYGVAAYNIFRSKGLGLRFYAASIAKLSFGMKNEEYTIADLDFECFGDSTGKICEVYTGD